MVDSAGNVLERYTYDAYGKVSTWTGNWATRTNPLYFNRILYGGAFFQDASTGLYYADARYYHPSLGRFISRDPMLTSFQDGVNLYQYVRSNPGNMVDPSGLAVGYSVDDRMRPLERARLSRELAAERARQASRGSGLWALLGWADEEVQQAYDQSNWDRTNGVLDGLSLNNADLNGYHGGNPNLKAHAFDPENRAQAACFSRCWALKMGDALTGGILGELPGNAGYLGTMPLNYASGLFGPDSPFDTDPEDLLGGVVGGLGVGINKYGKSIKSNRGLGGGARGQWHALGKPGYRDGVSFQDWARNERQRNELKGARLEKAGKALAALALGRELLDCYNKCKKCSSSY